MTERTETMSGLTRFSDSDLVLKGNTQDVYGYDVFEEDEQIGGVEHLYVDEVEREVRFVDAAAGGFLGIGEKPKNLPARPVQLSSEQFRKEHSPKSA